MLVRLLCFLVLAACAPSERLQRTYSDDTDIWQTVSRDTEVFRDAKDHVLARAIILEGGGEIRYYLSLSVLRGGPNGPRILTVAMNGEVMDYTPHDRLWTYCIDHCHRAEIGQIRLTETQFRQAANDGMLLDIDGRRRNYPAEVPARLFYNALQAGELLEPQRKPLP